MIAGVANGGLFVQPHLIKTFPNPIVTHFPISEETVQKVTDGMYGVVNEPGGTGYSSRIQNVEFSGKSGTAQIIGYDLRSRLGKEKEFKDNAWFVGYAPRRDPEIVVTVLVQGGGHGGEASAPIVRDIVKAYYNKKNGVQTQQTTTENRMAQPEQAKPEQPKPAVASIGATKP